MYDAADDIYCYPNSAVLKKVPGLRNARALKRYELAMSAQRAEEPLPPGRLSVTHYRAIHHHLFQDVYGWAGCFRRVRIDTESPLLKTRAPRKPLLLRPHPAHRPASDTSPPA